MSGPCVILGGSRPGIYDARVENVRNVLDAKDFYVVLYGHKTGIFFKWELIEPLVCGFSKSKHMSFKQLSSAIKFYCYKGKDSLDVEDNIYWYAPAQLNGEIAGITAQMTGLLMDGSSYSQDDETVRGGSDGQSGCLVQSDVENAARTSASRSSAITPDSSRSAAPKQSPVTIPPPACLEEADAPLLQVEWVYHID
ncbi:hypothetical protein WOLCODRAFT_15929 [Wolfiporia cocos MD-104 SS10]|uniref:Ribonuclease H1 N-terminal domain-containing protein n=1 Tax=Wolfiporia cocos (strain MD-104) TaxID=742152 RepID=A0A2H3J8M5_WOLCO|nr:hypothetical protein WOLCODRAFT_15929 [Wolfiporia cocos MD-104 SS10]